MSQEAEEYRSAFKAHGLVAAHAGNLDLAIDAFDRWQYAFSAVDGEDRYAFDYEILDAMSCLAEPYRATPRPKPISIKKLAFVLHGTPDLGSSLIRFSRYWAAYGSAFEIRAFAPESIGLLQASGCGMEHFDFFAAHGWQPYAPPDGAHKVRLLRLAEKIRAFEPDAVFFASALAKFQTHFLFQLRLAPIQVGLIAGDWPLFAAPGLDLGIAFLHRVSVSAPIPTAVVPLEAPLREEADEVLRTLRPEERPPAPILFVATGRACKFGSEFWRLARALMDAVDGVRLGVIGPTVGLCRFYLGDEQKYLDRVFLIPCTDDYKSYLAHADVVLDTFPFGGGLTVMDAVALGKPVITLRDDGCSRRFDQTDWRPATAILPEGEWIAQTEEEWLRIACRLATDLGYRELVGRRCQEHVFATVGDVRRMVRGFEAAVAGLATTR